MNLKELNKLKNEVYELKSKPLSDAVDYRLTLSLLNLQDDVNYKNLQLNSCIARASTKELLNYGKN